MKRLYFPLFSVVCAGLVWGGSISLLQPGPAQANYPAVPSASAYSPSLSIVAQPDRWYYPIHSGLAIVNTYLTPARVLNHPQPEHEGQTVLWEGRVLRQSSYQGKTQLLLDTPAGNVSVSFIRKARNLEFDRTGYRVAIKGNLHFKDGQFKGLAGQSCILLDPPTEFSYQRWLKGRPHSWEEFITWRILFHNPDMDYQQIKCIASAFTTQCSKQHIDPSLMAALIQIESAWDTDAVSPSGAQGLGQLMPKTAAGLNVADPFDPIQNLAGCTKMVSSLLKTWGKGRNPYASVLASYNAGPTLLQERKGEVPPYPETTNYVYFIGYVRQDLIDIIGKTPMPLI
ncbi:MAG: lytic transglycosylase domain-containing protein [Candidatus Bruticola sp.]